MRCQSVSQPVIPCCPHCAASIACDATSANGTLISETDRQPNERLVAECVSGRLTSHSSVALTVSSSMAGGLAD